MNGYSLTDDYPLRFERMLTPRRLFAHSSAFTLFKIYFKILNNLLENTREHPKYTKKLNIRQFKIKNVLSSEVHRISLSMTENHNIEHQPLSFYRAKNGPGLSFKIFLGARSKHILNFDSQLLETLRCDFFLFSIFLFRISRAFRKSNLYWTAYFSGSLLYPLVNFCREAKNGPGLSFKIFLGARSKHILNFDSQLLETLRSTFQRLFSLFLYKKWAIYFRFPILRAPNILLELFDNKTCLAFCLHIADNSEYICTAPMTL
ncbi:uncharacterized protein EV154DRAFT_488539 [Mucor mucedo]|uniref:uncharacterized protein n=1 Tax=Mucor mucedo TaxID=29922 RepID=UPI002220BA67|nr:uncharacterized protein EV154DRAFT_488539 [Mucor mucedo]KAI7866493.1 hypothetical protein EV154DRAFT_488539 [Mucor mucedo]